MSFVSRSRKMMTMSMMKKMVMKQNIRNLFSFSMTTSFVSDPHKMASNMPMFFVGDLYKNGHILPTGQWYPPSAVNNIAKM